MRRCYVCEHKDCVPPMRVFLLPGEPDRAPRCPFHGVMKPQANKVYRAARNGRPKRG